MSEAREQPEEIDVSEVTEQPTPVEGVRLVTSDPPMEYANDEPADEPEIISDGHCPLVVNPDEIDSRRVTQTVDGTKTVLRDPAIRLQQPTECPSCGKYFERHGLVLNDTYQKDCAVVVSYRQNPRFAAFFDALNKDRKSAETEAKKLKAGGIDMSALVAKRYP